jgi:hypothetical protein
LFEQRKDRFSVNFKLGTGKYIGKIFIIFTNLSIFIIHHSHVSVIIESSCSGRYFIILYENASEESKQSQYNNAKITIEKVLFRVQLGSTRRTEELESSGRLIFRAMRALNIDKKTDNNRNNK